MGLTAEVRPPGGEAITSEGIGMKGHLLKRWEGGEEVSREEAKLIIMEEKSPEGGQVTEGRQGHERRGEERRQRGRGKIIFVHVYNLQKTLKQIRLENMTFYHVIMFT